MKVHNLHPHVSAYDLLHLRLFLSARQEQMACFLDMKKSTYSMVEHGHRVASFPNKGLKMLHPLRLDPSRELSTRLKQEQEQKAAGKFSYMLLKSQHDLAMLQKKLADAITLYDRALDAIDRLQNIVIEPEEESLDRVRLSAVAAWKAMQLNLIEDYGPIVQNKLKLQIAGMQAEIDLLKTMIAESDSSGNADA